MRIRTFLFVAAVATVAATAAAHGQQTRDVQTAPRTGTAMLTGVVLTSDASPQPLRRAQVSVIAPDFSFNRTVLTDDSGRFTIGTLPAGQYMLSAAKPGYLRTAYGAKRYDRPGTTITLKDGQQMSDLTLRLIRGGVITGTVMDENGLPAYGVLMRVLQYRIVNGERTLAPAPVASALADTTDDRGIYRVYGLPPGEYVVAASPRLGGQGEIRAMTESEIRAVMQALQQQTQAAAAALQPGMSGVTSVQPTSPNPSTPRPDSDIVTVGYTPVFFPGTTNAGSAATIALSPGEERGGVDFALQLVRTTKVEGTISVPPGIAPQNVQVMMTPAGAGLTAGFMNFNRATAGPDGKFTFTSVPPGQYTLTASARLGGPVTGAPPPPPPPPPGAVVGGNMATFSSGGVTDMVMVSGPGGGGGSPYWAMANVTVDGTPVTGVALALQPGMTIAGRVEFRGTRALPPTDLTRVRLMLMPVSTGGGPTVVMSGVPSAQVDSSGRFTISGVVPGRYRISGVAPVTRGSGPGMEWMLKSALIKGRDVLDFLLDVEPNDSFGDALITFSDSVQEVNGSLQDSSGRPAPDYTIVVFAADKAYWTASSRRIRTTRPSTDGRFSVSNLPPGEYRIAAVVDMAPEDANDPAFLEQLVAASYAFTLAEGQRKTQDLRISGGL